MQRFTNSSLKVRKNRFRETGSKFESVSITTVELGNSINSIDFRNEFYTNYASTEEQKVYKIIKKLYLKILNEGNNIFGEYVCDELYYNGKVIQRLINIINESNNNEYNIEDLKKIYKLKNRDNPKIHLYITVDGDFAKIVLIDLYHLSIPADVYSNGRLVKRVTLNDLKMTYEKLKNNEYNLNHMIKDESKMILQ